MEISLRLASSNVIYKMKNVKNSILVIALGLMGFATLNASASSLVENTIEQEPKKEKVKEEVDMENLPVEIQKDIKITYPDADFVRAYRKTKTAEEEVTYEVVLENDGKEVTLMYDAKGKILK